MKGLSWGDKLFLAELGPEHVFLMDYILYCRSLEYFVLFRPKNLSKTQDGMGNPSCVAAGKHFSSLFGESSIWLSSSLCRPKSLAHPGTAGFGEGNAEGREVQMDAAQRTVLWGTYLQPEGNVAV